MKTVMILAMIAHLSFAALPAAQAAGAVFLFGGGPRPPAALEELVRAAAAHGVAGDPPRLLLVGWASEVPDDTMAGLRDELAAAGAAVALAASAPRSPTETRSFLALVHQADGVFFSGGDQNRILDAWAAAPELRDAILARWSDGAALAGTSAGTAVLSKWVFTGSEDLTRIDARPLALREGLGVLGETVVDQHFLKRQRENRLFSAVLRYPGALGIGVDEGNVLVVEGSLAQGDHSVGHVIGPTGVMFVEQNNPATTQLAVSLLAQGDCWDFAARRAFRCH